jgi:hypothetical protein
MSIVTTKIKNNFTSEDALEWLVNASVAYAAIVGKELQVGWQ